MIREVTLRRFKRFEEETFPFPGHIVLAGPNNTGKTTALQAIAAWELAFNRWRERNDFQRRNGGYTRVPIARQDFAAVPLLTYDLLWNQRQYHRREPIKIGVRGSQGWTITMELIPDTTEQIFIRPTGDVAPNILQQAALQTVYVPPMTGLSTQEPVYQTAYQRVLLGQGKPGDIIRNLLVQVNQRPEWNRLVETVQLLFGYEILPPNAMGAYITAEYRPDANARSLDIASAGSGFQQVLMLLTFLYSHPATVLLIDEPDAHLHVLLQDAIYSKLRSVAEEQRSQLIISTHSEVIIDSVEPRELCMLLDHPRLLVDRVERDRLNQAMRYLDNMDIMLALAAPGILYTEGHTDVDILRECAKTLEHPLYDFLCTHLFWKPKVINPRPNARGCNAPEHFELLKLVKEDIRGVELVDGDDHGGRGETAFELGKLQRLRWQRYEIESYLVHPAAIERFIARQMGGEEASVLNREAAREYMAKQMPSVVEDPHGDHIILNVTKASNEILPRILTAADIFGVQKRDFFQIAAAMQPEEIHPEIVEKLDAIQRAFGL